MLVHKATMGVLNYIWTGDYTRSWEGQQVPMDRPATLEDVDDPAEWWEVSGPLARKIERYYPLLRPVVDGDGNLSDAVPLEAEEREQDRQQNWENQRQEARGRGYRRSVRMRPRGLMPFINSTEEDKGFRNTRM